MLMISHKRGREFDSYSENPLVELPHGETVKGEDYQVKKKICLEKPEPSQKLIQGRIHIGVAQDRSKVLDTFSSFPLRFIDQETWNPHVTISMMGFTAGLSAGEAIKMNIMVDANSSACFKTVGTTKVFKAKEEKFSSQELEVEVKRNGLLVMVPDPVACYDHAKYVQKQRYTIDEDSSAVIVDWFTSGRQNLNEFWNFESFHNSITLMTSENKFLLAENQFVQNKDPERNSNAFGYLAKEFNNVHLCGILILYGSKTAAIRSSLSCFQNRQTFAERYSELAESADEPERVNKIPLLSVSTINENLSLVRFMIPTIQYGYELISEILKPLGEDDLNGMIPYQDRLHFISPSDNNNGTAQSGGELRDSKCPIEILRAYRNKLTK